jgi:hypothetical protein
MIVAGAEAGAGGVTVAAGGAGTGAAAGAGVGAGSVGGGGVTTGGGGVGVSWPLYEGRTLPSGPIDCEKPLADTRVPRTKTSTVSLIFMDFL